MYFPSSLFLFLALSLCLCLFVLLPPSFPTTPVYLFLPLNITLCLCLSAYLSGWPSWLAFCPSTLHVRLLPAFLLTCLSDKELPPPPIPYPLPLPSKQQQGQAEFSLLTCIQ